MPALPQPAAPDFASARFNMVESQIRPNKVRDPRILEAMGALPREIFVPLACAGIAYIDEDVQVMPGRYLLEPMVLARLLEEANIKAGDRVLDIAPATGYSTAVIASMAKDVVALESDPSCVQLAVRNLDGLQIKNAELQLGALAEGWDAKAPYDVILINGGIEVLPSALLSQLAEGGRLLLVVRQFGPAHAAHKGEARLYEKIHGTMSHRALFDANVKLLPGFEAKKTFTF
jgi:protein-L-isoaspartate(D-aspartate) O-methyltransferase